MLSKDHCHLIYVGQATKENGSPEFKEIKKEVRCDLADTFSSNYYFERGREMRNSLRLVVNVYYTFDITDDDGLSYYLKFVEYDNVRYTVENILNHYMHNFKKDKMKRDLDLRKTL